MNRIINEGLDYMDFENIISSKVTVDEYSAKSGKDEDIVTVSFTVRGEQAANDLVDWFERGYDFVHDAEVSEGELDVGKYVVFVEMTRRSKVPERIIELLTDLETLTGLKLKDWTVKIEDEDYEADPEVLKQKIILSPSDYRKLKETELNEMRELSGVQPHKIFDDQDKDIKHFKSLAGL
jgi:hypothetical protein